MATGISFKYHSPPTHTHTHSHHAKQVFKCKFLKFSYNHKTDDTSFLLSTSQLVHIGWNPGRPLLKVWVSEEFQGLISGYFMDIIMSYLFMAKVKLGPVPSDQVNYYEDNYVHYVGTT